MAKHNYNHMIQEIQDEPEILAAVLKREHEEEVRAVVRIIEAALHRNGQIFLVGSGSSYHSALYGSNLFSLENNFYATALSAGEFGNIVADLDSKSLVILVSQSGDNPDILEILRDIKTCGADILTLTNDPDSMIAEVADVVFPFWAGPEKAVPATKTYLAELGIWALISESLKNGSALFRAKEEIVAEIKKIISDSYQPNLSPVLKEIANAEAIYILGGGVELANAKECALKFKECDLAVAEAIEAEEFQHGPQASIKLGSTVIVFTAGMIKSDLNNLIKIVKEHGGKVIGIGPERADGMDQFLPIADFKNFTPLCSIIPAQLLSYHWAIKKGLNPDQPEGVSK